MAPYGFAPARVGEVIVYGAQRPGYRSTSVCQPVVSEWIAFMEATGIQRVCCLLADGQLAYYGSGGGLLDLYRRAFGDANVLSAPIIDYHLSDRVTLETAILPFLFESDRTNAPTVVHCSGGSGRTGHVLATWLVRRYGMSVVDAVAAVAATGRNPQEAVGFGNATELELRDLLNGNCTVACREERKK